MRLISGTLCSTPLPWLPVLSNIEPPALRRKAATDKLVEKIVKHDSWPMQPDILNPPLLRLTSRKPLWLDLQSIDIKSRWRHNWKSAQVVNSYTYYVRPHNPATGFWPSSATWSLLQCGLYWTVLLRNRDTALPVEGNGDLQTLICVQLRWDPNGVTHCQILSSDKAEWRLIPTTLCRCQMKTLIPGWAIMVHDTHTRRKSSYCWALTENPTQGIKPLRVTPNLGSGPSFWNCGAFAILL